jgi:four helix bundle protein
MTKPNDLIQRTHQFALQALAFFRLLPKCPEAQVVGIQLYRAATAVESNYRAAKRGRSTAIHRKARW